MNWTSSDCANLTTIEDVNAKIDEEFPLLAGLWEDIQTHVPLNP